MSVVICTRNRGASIAATISSILAIDDMNFELVIVDQSTNDETARAIAVFESDSRVCLTRSETVGLGVARNIGLGKVRSDLVAYTDDDCTVPKDWLNKIYQAFHVNPRIALVYTSVAAAPYDPLMGNIPVYLAVGDEVYTNVHHKRRARGIGASMAVRASFVRHLGGFDEMLGAGGRFPAAEDWDIAVRALIRGYCVYETDRVSVLHFGFRSHEDGKALSKRDWIGVGAAYSKPIRCGHFDFLIVIADLLTNYALRQFFQDLAHLQKPRGLLRIVYFFQGFLGGMRLPLNKTTMCFQPSAIAAA